MPNHSNRKRGYDAVVIAASLGGIAHDRATSEAFAIPQTAIATGCVDEVLPLDAVGPLTGAGTAVVAEAAV